MEREAKEKVSSDCWDWFEIGTSQTMAIEQDGLNDFLRLTSRC